MKHVVILKKMKYCVIDTESGSRKPESSLLTAYFLIVDKDFNKIDSLHLILKPETDCLYVVDAQGLAINGINIVEHDKIAITYKQAKPQLYDFLKKHSIDERLTPVGHAVKGDIRRIVENLISQGSWEQFCTYHFIDTSVVLQFLRACGKMSLDTDGSVEALSNYFDIKTDGNLHDARTDTELTIEILKKFVEIGKS